MFHSRRNVMRCHSLPGENGKADEPFIVRSEISNFLHCLGLGCKFFFFFLIFTNQMNQNLTLKLEYNVKLRNENHSPYSILLLKPCCWRIIIHFIYSFHVNVIEYLIYNNII